MQLKFYVHENTIYSCKMFSEKSIAKVSVFMPKFSLQPFTNISSKCKIIITEEKLFNNFIFFIFVCINKNWYWKGIYPLSLSDSNCFPVSLRGSPLESTATASNSSKLGATKSSLRLLGRCCDLRANVQHPSPPPPV